MNQRVLFLIVIHLCIALYNCSDNHKHINEDDEIKELSLIDEYLIKASDKEKSKEERELLIEKAVSIYNTLSDDMNKREKTSKLSAAYYDIDDQESSKKMDKEMLRLSKSINDSLGIAQAYANLGIYYRKKNILDSTYFYFYEANRLYTYFDKEQKFKHSQYAYHHGKVLIDLAKLSRKVKDYGQSESLTIQAIEKFKKSGNLRYIPLSYNNLGIVAKQSGRYKDAVGYFEKSIEYSKNSKKELLYLTQSYNNIGTTYKSQEKYDAAVDYLEKALAHKDFLKKNPKRIARLYDNLGYVKFLINKKNDSSLYLFKKALYIRDSINDIVGISTSNLHFAEYYQYKGDYTLSKKFAKRTEQLANETHDNDELLQTYEFLAKVSPPSEGRQYAMKYIKLSDSLTKRDNLFRDKFARIRFESDNLQKENEQKSQEIQEVQNQNTIYLLGMLLLVTFIAFIIYFSRQRTRYLAQQNKIVEFQAAYETETRISKRLHDEIGNDIFQVMMQYQNDPHDPQITKKLNTAYNKARDISRENSEFEVDETYTEELTDMLTNYTENHSKLILRGIDKINWDMVDKNLKITIYRVLQELMTNMQKHSQADLVAIVFKNEKNKLLIKYSDNGIGIEQEDIKSKNGLRNTEKRVQAIQGNITFDSAKDKGFKAEIKIPV
ncbi:ATP-binding protein [uncultured Aquimarina sp.]|uniref:ATP-binding protein n=1 Tax=uncultured Aquimarina sp. TaxID=575652 RepID=UPI00262CEA9F|nr:tetratricopeptide repeat protein [uncultured Aquimarina sp.]